jgi:hypothetical protein
MPINTQFNNPFANAANMMANYGLQQMQFGPRNEMYAAQTELAKQTLQKNIDNADRTQAMRVALADMASKGAYDRIPGIMVQYPEIGQQLIPANMVITENERRSAIEQQQALDAAQAANKPEIYNEWLRDRATAAHNTGTPESEKRAAQYGSAMQQWRDNPAQHATVVHAGAYTMMTPEERDQATFGGVKMQKAQYDAQKAQQDAASAGYKAQSEEQRARFAPQREFGIADTAQANAEKARVMAQGSAATGAKAQGAVSDRQAQGKTEVETLQDMIQQADDLVADIDKNRDKYERGINATGPWQDSRWFPTLSGDTQRLHGRIKTLRSGAGFFLSPHQTGPMTENDRIVAESMGGTLTTDQDLGTIQEGARNVKRLAQQQLDIRMGQYGQQAPASDNEITWDELEGLAKENGLTMKDAYSRSQELGLTLR